MVVALDNSMSMQATGAGPRIRRWALEQLAELRPGDRAAVLRMHPSPTWIVPLTDDLAAVRRGVTEAQPGFATTRYAASLRVAGELLVAQAATERIVLWLADDQRIGWATADLSQPLPAGVTLRANAACDRATATSRARLAPDLPPACRTASRLPCASSTRKRSAPGAGPRP